MAYTPTRFYQGQPGTGETTLLAATATAKIIKQIVLNNTTATAATVSIGIVSSTAANRLIQALSVPANSVIVLDLSVVLASSEIITGLQGTASAISVHISGVVIT